MMGRIAVVACALAVVLAAWWVWPTEARAVRARVISLVDALDTTADETDLQRIARAATLVNALTPDVVVTIDADRRVVGRDMVLGMARQVVQTRRNMRVELDDLDVVLGADRATAVANVTLRIDDDTSHDVRLLFVRPESTWLVQSAEIVHPLTRPGGM